MNFIPYIYIMGIKNKNIIKKSMIKCGLMMVVILGLFITLTPKASAATKLEPKDWISYIVHIWSAYMDQYFSTVHFNVGGNDFWWGILRLPVEQIAWDAVEIKIPTWDPTPGNEYDAVYCSSKVRGFYWNSQRWDNRLWPLDDITHKWLLENADKNEKEKGIANFYTGLTLTWWLYTTCSEDRPTADLMNFIEENGVWISIAELKRLVDLVVDDLVKIYWKENNDYKEIWAENMDDVFKNHNITDSDEKMLIKQAILSWASFWTDPYWIYWKLTHEYLWDKMDLIAWAHYDMAWNRISKGELTCSLQWLSNNYPFGYIYDDYWHIWMVGARITSSYLQWSKNNRQQVTNFHSWLNQLLNSWVCMDEVFWFDWKDLKLIKREMTDAEWWYNIPWRSDTNSLWKAIGSLSSFLTAWNGTARTTVFSLWIKGIVWLTDEVRDSQKEYFENNQLQSTLMLRTETSISNIINAVSKNAERICRGKWTTNSSILQWSQKLVCYNWDKTDQFIATPKQMAWKTIIVKGGADMIIDMRTPNDYQSNSETINLFVDGGNMLLYSEWVSPHELMCFDEYWYLVGPEACGDIRAMFLKWNFIVNGLILWGPDWWSTVDSRLYMHGKVVSYNTLTTPTANRKNTILHILGLPEWTALPDWISLTKLFNWSCNAVTWEGSDKTSCKWVSSIGSESQLVDKAFWLIDMDIKSELLNY